MSKKTCISRNNANNYHILISVETIITCKTYSEFSKASRSSNSLMFNRERAKELHFL